MLRLVQTDDHRHKKSEEASEYQTLELSNELKCQFAATTEICKAVDKLITPINVQYWMILMKY